MCRVSAGEFLSRGRPSRMDGVYIEDELKVMIGIESGHCGPARGLSR